MDKVTEADREAAKNFSNLAYLRRLQHEALERALAQAFATHRIEAARLGIIEGLEMALVELEKIAHWGAGDLTLGDAEEAIRALIEEQKL